jgi:ABC-type Mn2+/Zn2+ transport system ATPase subunit
MKVVYLGRASRRETPAPMIDGDVLELLSSNWDDFGNKTTFATTCRIGGETVELGHIKLMVDGEWTTSSYLDGLRAGGWNGELPLPQGNYLSVPGEISFYEQLDALLNPESALDVARRLRDASYLVNTERDPAAISLIESTSFKKSLQRERGDVKAFLDGWKIFARQAMAVLDLGFRFNDVFGETSTLELKFQARGPLPHDVNVLIGPNGVGKSQVLHQIVKDWLTDDPTDDRESGFVQKPNLSQIVVVSYSPFEQFPVDLRGRKRQDQDAYRYFGFRGRSVPQEPKKLGGIKLTHEALKRNAAASLLDCLADDVRYRALAGWSQKLKTAERVLKSAFAFDFAAVMVEDDGGSPEQYYNDTGLIVPLIVDVEDDLTTSRFVPICSDRISELNIEAVKKRLIAAEGVTFFLNGQPVELSSGQKLFSFIVINILGAIRRDSLILIDEPELFLHPTLEIQFIDMLKKILARFNSKALLATHSVVTVREVPADCVHVFERTNDGLVLKKPPFQTFGGDVQRITSYVFGDSAASKPFERWIKEQLEEYGSAKALIEALGDDLNEELIVQIQAMGRVEWL